MSLVEKLCKELGVEVGEEWLGSDGVRYKIGLFGQILQFDIDGHVIMGGYDRWADIFAGDLKPVWEPKPDEKYYVPSVYAPEKYMHSTWEYTPRDRMMYERGIIFKTREEAIEITNKMLQLVKEERLNGGD